MLESSLPSSWNKNILEVVLEKDDKGAFNVSDEVLRLAKYHREAHACSAGPDGSRSKIPSKLTVVGWQNRVYNVLAKKR